VSDPLEFTQAVDKLLAQAKQSYQRRLLLLAGEQAWAYQQADIVLARASVNRVLWVGAHTPSFVAPSLQLLTNSQARQYLGQETDLLIYDGWSGLDPSALSALCGTVKAGGLVVIMMPVLTAWAQFDDPDYQRLLVHPFNANDLSGRFLRRLQQSLLSDAHCLRVEQKHAIAFSPPAVAKAVDQSRDDDSIIDACITADQSKAVAAIIRVQQGHSRRPLVITADRGRGKSAALGIASAKLMLQQAEQSPPLKIIISAPLPSSVMTAFKHVSMILAAPAATDTRRLTHGLTSFEFVAPDELLRHHYEASLLLIDEAAAIPASLLEKLLARYSRIVFSSTVHGYEGTGRGFDIRFKATLDEKTPQWKALSLQQPVRWSANDPVESWLFKAMLLSAEPIADDNLSQLQAGLCVTELIERDQLLVNEADLSGLFGLLVAAHYQTSPDDLRILLDGPNISVWVSRYQGQIVAAALLAAEGGFDEPLAIEVTQGRRRPRGHLIPQTLAAHAGFQSAPLFRYQRVVRIAVHPAVQRSGIGQQLMSAIVEKARVDHFDFVGSSFAATKDMLAFWSSLNFISVRLGISRDSSSGCHSAVVLSALSISAGELLNDIRQRFVNQLPQLLPQLYPLLEAELVLALMNGAELSDMYKLDQQDFMDINAFIAGQRQYKMCAVPLWKLAVSVVCLPGLNKSMNVAQQQLLVSKILQANSDVDVVATFSFTGTKELMRKLRKLVALIKPLLHD
jgi:tRNA(Met) cytidine acetyltransferase